MAISAALAAGAERPNVVVVLADDLGYGDVSCLNPRALWRTPAVDRLAGEGMLFTDAHSSSGLCTPTRYTLMTGRYSWRGRLKRDVLNGYEPALIEPGRLTLAGFLRAEGYATAMLGKWHLGLNWELKGRGQEDVDWSRPAGGGPAAHGFERFFGISASLDMPPYVWIRNDRVTAAPAGRVEDSPAPRLWRAGLIGGDFVMEAVQPTLTAMAVEYLEERAVAKDGRPFFLYVALASPHTPTLATAEFAGTTPTQYGDFVRQVDADVGKILAALDRTGLAQNTLVVFSSDNGFAPAGDIPPHRPLGHDPSGGWRGVKSDAFEGGHRVPLVARWPGVTPRGSVAEVTVGQWDLFATLAEAMGVGLPGDAAEDSASILAVLRGVPGARPVGREAVVHHSADGEFALRRGKWKLILAPGSGGWSPPTKRPSPWTQPMADDFTGLPPYQLYDLEADPAERVNRAAEEPEVTRELGRLMRRYVLEGRSTLGPAQPVSLEDWPQLDWMEDFAL